MKRPSAGLLLHRDGPSGLEVFLVHPGGPFHARKDEGAWSIPKGEIGEGEGSFDAARREFTEETGFPAPTTAVPMTPVRQAGGKTVHAWAARGNVDPTLLESNTFTMEWPPKSGRTASFPEVDRGAWFDLATARRKINPGQVPLLDELVRLRTH
jgi:predicted NUDIX family NTP pyrophosphohydrolase